MPEVPAAAGAAWDSASLPLLFSPAHEVADSEVREAAASDPTALVSLVEALGPLLTDDRDLPARRAGLEFLARVAALVPRDSLSSVQCKLLMDFFEARLADEVGAWPATSVVTGFSGLFLGQSKAFKESGDVRRIVEVLLEGIYPQSLMVATRKKIFQTISFALVEKLQLLLAAPEDFAPRFVQGFSRAVEGETNPANLRIIFGCWPIIIKSFSCDVTEVVESFECYFPIDFDASKSTSGVSREDLSSALCRCFASSPVLARESLPLFLDKLGSDLASAKVESLIYMRECLTIYPVYSYQDHLREIWQGCQRTLTGISSATTPEVVGETYALIKSLSKTLSQDLSARQLWLDLAWKELKRFLAFTDWLLNAAIDALSCIAEADVFYANAVLDQTIPILLESFQRNEEETVAEAISKIFKSCAKAHLQDPLWFGDFLQTCRKGTFQGKTLSLRSHFVNALISSRLVVPKAAHLDGLVFELSERLLNDSESGVSQETRFDLAKAVISADQERAKLWCKNSLSSSNVSIIAALCEESEEVAQEMHVTLLQKLRTGGDQAVVAIDLLTRYDSNSFRRNFLSHLMDVKLNLPTAERKCLDLLSLIGRKLSGDDVFVQSAVDVLLSSEVNKQSRICELLISLHPDLIVALGNTDRIFDSDLPRVEHVFRARASIINKVSVMSEEMTAYLSSLCHGEPTRSLDELAWMLRAVLMKGCNLWSKALTEEFLSCLNNPANDVEKCVSIVLAEDYGGLGRNNYHKVLGFYKQRFFHATAPTLISWHEKSVKKDSSEDDEIFQDAQEDLQAEGGSVNLFLDAVMFQLPHVPGFVARTSLIPMLPALISGLFSTRFTSAAFNFLAFIRTLETAQTELILPFLFKVASPESGASIKDRASALEAVESLASTSSGSIRESRSLVIKHTEQLIGDPKRLVRKAAVAARNSWMMM